MLLAISLLKLAFTSLAAMHCIQLASASMVVWQEQQPSCLMHSDVQVHKQCLLTETTTRGRGILRERALSLPVSLAVVALLVQSHTHTGQADADRMVEETDSRW